MNKKKLNKKKGFTLIELIVVIAILGILAAIAIPRFSGMQASAKVKAEGATAAQIISACRIQETENDGVKVTALTQTGTAAAGDLQTSYMTVPKVASHLYTIVSGTGGSTQYKITWASAANGYGTQIYTENETFVPTP